jgi:hypothetical protein
VAVADTATTPAGTPVTLDLLANDSDPDGDPLTLTGVTLPAHGTLAVNPDQSVTYTPAAGFAGEDGFAYTVADGRGGSAVGEATMTVQAPPSDPAFANGYAFRRRLVVPPRPLPAETLDGFVLHVAEQGEWLKGRTLGGGVESAQGLDLRFELEDGTKLAHEVDIYDGAIGRLVAWVRLPAWAVTEQLRLLLYYGKPGLTQSEADPAAVWAGYAAVWDVRTGLDRSGQGRDVVMTGVAPQPLLGGAGAFDGVGAHGRRAAAQGVGWLAELSAMTVQAVVKSSVTGQRRGIIAQGPAGGTAATSSLFLAYVEATWAGATRAVQFQWRNPQGSSYIVSQSDRQTTGRQILHATWSSGQAPRLYLDGVEETAPARAEANAGTGVVPDGDLWLGVAPGPLDPAATGWNGLIDEVRIHPAVLSAGHIACEAASMADPQGFYGLGDEEAAEDGATVVAVPLTATTVAGGAVDIPALAAAFIPEGAGPASLTVVTPPAMGTATVVSDQLRYSASAGPAGGDSFTYAVSSGGRTSTAKVTVDVLAAPALPLPSGYSWTLLGSHPTGWITQQVITDNWNAPSPEDAGSFPYRRLSIANAPDGTASLKHTVKDGELVWPVGFRAPDLARQNSLDKAYLLRYRHWIVDYPGSSGKWHELEGGRGWVAQSYRYGASTELGSDGWGFNVMHPKRGTGADGKPLNGIGMLSSHAGQSSAYGATVQSGGSWVVPQGRWVTIDVLVVCPSTPTGTDGAYRILVDGSVLVQLNNIRPAQSSMADVKTLRLFVRLMDGGNPDDPAQQHVRPYSEHFAGFEIWRGN